MSWSIRAHQTRTARHHRTGRERLTLGDLRVFCDEADKADLPDDAPVRVTVEAMSEGGGCRVSIEASVTEEIGDDA